MAVISEAEMEGALIEQGRVAVWNERIASRSTRAGQRNSDTTLQGMSVGGDAVTMVGALRRGESRRLAGCFLGILA